MKSRRSRKKSRSICVHLRKSAANAFASLSGLFFRQVDPQFAQAVADFARGFGDPHALLDHQLAGKRGAALSAGTHVIVDTAVLAFLVPAEAAQRDIFRGKILKGAQQHVAFRHGDFASTKSDLDEFFIRPEHGPWAGHKTILSNYRKKFRSTHHSGELLQ